MPVIYILAIALLSTAVACDFSSNSNNKKSDHISEDIARSSGRTADSKGKCLNVVGGAPTEEYPYVGLLSVSGGSGICTGTFLGHNTMVTASHCVASKTKNGDLVYVKNPPKNLTEESVKKMFKNGVKPLKVLIGNKAKANDAQNNESPMIGAAKDIAILIFPDDTAPETISILKREATVDDQLMVIGYGSNEWKDKSEGDSPMENIVKKSGKNNIMTLDQELLDDLEQRFDGEFYLVGGPAKVSSKTSKTALGAKGDSGGPLLLNETIVGVLTVGMKTPEEIKPYFGNKTAATMYVKMQSDFTKDLIKRAQKEGATFDYTDDEKRKPTKKIEQNGKKLDSCKANPERGDDEEL